MIALIIIAVLVCAGCALLCWWLPRFIASRDGSAEEWGEGYGPPGETFSHAMFHAVDPPIFAAVDAERGHVVSDAMARSRHEVVTFRVAP